MASIMQSGRIPSQNLVICLLLWLVNLWVVMTRSQLVRAAKWHSAFGLLHKIFPKQHTQWNRCNSRWNGMKMWVSRHSHGNNFHLILCRNTECTRSWLSCCNVARTQQKRGWKLNMGEKVWLGLPLQKFPFLLYSMKETCVLQIISVHECKGYDQLFKTLFLHSITNMMNICASSMVSVLSLGYSYFVGVWVGVWSWPFKHRCCTRFQHVSSLLYCPIASILNLGFNCSGDVYSLLSEMLFLYHRYWLCWL